MAKQALVVKREILFREGIFSGFVSTGQRDFIGHIMTNHFYHDRGEKLENDSSIQQIIPYVWIVNPKTKEVFAYRRASNQNYSEARLRNKWSCGVGGHIDFEDSGKENPILSAMMRELMEEVKIAKYPRPKIVGYINDDSDIVNSVHFGVVAVAETDENVEKGDEEMAEGRFFSLSDLEKLFADSNVDVEKWTRTSWPFVKQYLLSL
jgi:predicted NUDIX family phosphoesterase